jgi:peptide/nickel transport system substrate-binding protein
MTNRRDFLAGSLASAAAAAFPSAARAQGDAPLRIGLATEWFALDPHFHTFPTNLSIAHHAFSALTATDAQDRLVPSLAESWHADGKTGWVFKIRPNAKFSDGTAVTAHDVVATIARIPTVKAGTPLTIYIRGVTGASAIDDTTVKVATAAADPLLPKNLSAIYIVPKRVAGEPTEAFNGLTAAIGSGPYRFVRWDRGERLILAPNEHHWAGPPPFRNVVYRVITEAASRVAALLAGDVDVIQSASTESVDRLEKQDGIRLFKAASSRITYIQFHQGPASLADMAGSDGKNPFADARVRRAVSLAIPRQAIKDRIMSGLSTPTLQIVAPGREGHDPAMTVPPPDLNTAVALMREAGWEKGFQVTLTTPNDRNVNGVKIAEVVAAALTRLNIKVTVNAVPLAVQQAGWRAGKQSMFLHGNGPQVEPYSSLVSLTHTKNMSAALGVSNESFYSNSELDAVIEASIAEIDEAKRQVLMLRAARIAHDTTALVPIHHEVIVHGARRGISLEARGDERIFAADTRLS